MKDIKTDKQICCLSFERLQGEIAGMQVLPLLGRTESIERNSTW